MKILSVKVKPNAKRQSIQLEVDGSLTAQLKSPPVDGQANSELIQALATFYQVPKSSIRIKSGANSKFKRVEIDLD